MITPSSNGKDVTRNTSYFKKIPKQGVNDKNKQIPVETARQERPVRQRRRGISKGLCEILVTNIPDEDL